MGASREMTILALVEPTMLVAIFALSVPVGSTNLAASSPPTLHDPSRVISPASLLAARGAGRGRDRRDRPAPGGQPVHPPGADDDPRGDGAGVRRAGPGAGRAGLGDAADRVPRAAGRPCSSRGASRPTRAPALLALGALAFVVKVALLGAALAAGEVFLAKLRLFRVPELLAGSFVLALLAVAASFFLA